MKKILSSIFMIVCIVSALAAKPDFGEGTTFQRGESTLDFYNNGLVVYSANNGAPSRSGEYTISSSPKSISNYGYTVPLTVKIYVGERTVTMRGTITYDRRNKPLSIRLDGKTWKKW